MMHKTTRPQHVRFSLFILGLIFTQLAWVKAHASTILFETGFEANEYALGTVAGQNGWDGNNPDAGTVQNMISRDGSQAVRVDPVAGQDITSLGLSYDSVGNDEKLVIISIDMLLTGAANASFQGPGAFGNTGFSGQTLVNGNTRRVTSIGLPNRASTFLVNYDEWFTWQLHLNFHNQTVSTFVDGNLVFSDDFINPALTRLTSFTAFGTNSGAGGGAPAYYDNLVVSSHAVPAPATLALLIVALAGLLVPRRRKLA